MPLTTDLKSSTAGEQLLALNNAFAEETSYLTPAEWHDLIDRALYALAIDTDAFILAYDQSPREVSINYDWFKARYDSFLYIDRVVIAASAQGRGLGRRLYQHLIDLGRAAGFARIVCEVNSDPPNPVSLTFHDRLGFTPVGEQTLPNGKTVRYFEKPL